MPAAESTTGKPSGVPSRALDIVLQAAGAVHVEHIPARAARPVPWPDWVAPEIISAFAQRGIHAPWSHQAAAASHAQAGRNVILSTAAASGKSLGYLLPALTAIAAGETVLYVTPAKALAADQLAALSALEIPGLRAAVLDGDSSRAERDWARSHARYLLTTPDMLHCALLPGHARWSGFLSRLRYVIVDECHSYRGVFGSHVAQVLRRLRRVAAHHAGRGPVFMLASATIGEPAEGARLLTGLPAIAVTDDGSPHGPLAFALLQPRQPGAERRLHATATAADLLARLVREKVPTLAFVRSRSGAEAVALGARRHLDGGPADQVAAYRSGFLAEDRRGLEAALTSGSLTGLATTTALELGINITGLDAVLMAGWPGTWASLWQQAGRAGRAGSSAAAVLIPRDDPLDSYLVRHPDVLLRHPVETAVLDPANGYVLAPHLAAAAVELPLTEADIAIFGPAARPVLAELTRSGRLRRRPDGWYALRREFTSLRGAGLRPVRVVEEATGQLVGTVDEPSAHLLIHDGAVYLHQGCSYLVSNLHLPDRVALVSPGSPGYSTAARSTTEIEVMQVIRRTEWGAASLSFGDVHVTRQVVGYTRRGDQDGASLGETALDLPPRRLATRAMWWSISADQREGLLAAGVDIAGAVHAVEHASIAMLPLFATCDRGDVGGVPAELGVFIYDGYEGGAGFAERAFGSASAWLGATRQAIWSCDCHRGCPSCVQSPRCGSGNHPLSKTGAVALLDVLLPASPEVSGNSVAVA
jgi:DEAD/DEAH box helicase domain-containing protein